MKVDENNYPGNKRKALRARSVYGGNGKEEEERSRGVKHKKSINRKK